MTSIRAGVGGSVLAAAAVFSTVALAAPASAAPDKAGNPSAQAVSCDSTFVPPNLDPTVGGFLSTANIRTGASTSCTSVGQGQPGHQADYFCYVSGDGGTWTYLRDLDTGRQGWVRDDLLVGFGSFVPC